MNTEKTYVIPLNSLQSVREGAYCDEAAKFPVYNGSGELLILVETVAGGDLIVYEGNTVFGGKRKMFELSDSSRVILRLEVGPHLITDAEGSHVVIQAPFNATVVVMDVK